MVETSDEPSLLDRIRSKAHVSKPDLAGVADRRSASLVIDTHNAGTAAPSTDHVKPRTHDRTTDTSSPSRDNVTEKTSAVLPPPAPPPQAQDANGETSAPIDTESRPNLAARFYYTTKEILLASYINVLLVFVPIGIAVNFAGVNPTIVFALNAIAIVPLASLLSYATESVASSMGDTVGALMNVTFGNAVELIIL